MTAQALLQGWRRKNKSQIAPRVKATVMHKIACSSRQPDVVNQLAESTDLLHDGLCPCVNLPASSRGGPARKEPVGAAVHCRDGHAGRPGCRSIRARLGKSMLTRKLSQGEEWHSCSYYKKLLDKCWLRPITFKTLC